ncbi:MAG: DUF5606 domain-containing protein [Bacteroidales bacterium]|nr:DUF5606 domain-containing protein [Bacteroidales bacterium]
MDLRKILVISGKPGLYELVSQTKGGAIVESLIDKRRCPVFRNDRISSLNEISIFVEDGDKPLAEVMQDIFRKQDGKQVEIDIKKASSDEVFAFFKEVEPSYDTDRVHASDVKKILSWYNLLVANEKIDLEEPKEESVEE